MSPIANNFPQHLKQQSSVNRSNLINIPVIYLLISNPALLTNRPMLITMFIYLFIYLFIKLRHSHGYKQVAGSPQQCTPITVGPSKIIKYGQFENTTQLIAIQHHTVQYNTIQYMYNTIHHNRIQYYSKNKIQLPPPLPPPAAEYLVYRANQLHAH